MPEDCARSTASRATWPGSISRPSSSAWRICARLGDGRLAALLLAAEEAGEHLLDVDVHLLDALVRHDLEGRERLVGDLDLDHAVLELALAQHRRAAAPASPRPRSRGSAGRSRSSRRCLGAALRAVADLERLLLADHLDGDLGQVAHDRLDVAADVADLGELRGLDLEERRVGQARQAPRDLGLADARRPDHQDVLRQDLARHLGREALPAPAVAQRDRHGLLRALLADDVLVELGDDLARRARGGRRGLRPRARPASGKPRQSSSSVMWSLV